MTHLITATEVKDETQRLDFTPSFFGNYFLEGEMLTYAFMEQLSSDYGGGLWLFYKLSNGGFYMAPDHGDLMQVSWAENYYSGQMSADAAGITACLFALSHLCCAKQDDLLAQRFHALRDFALKHKEAAEIFRAID